MAFKLVGNQFIDTNAPEYQMYNTLGRDAGSTANNGGNIFTKRASSIGNAVGTTLSAPISLAHDIGENIATANLLKDTKTRMNDIAKKYGYKTWADWQDGYAAAKESGDTAKFNEMTKQLEEFKAQANANASEANAKAAGYEDYRQNNLISQNINQDRGKFLGSAINTLSTATDLLGLTNGPISNAVQGGIEGVADELEQNGLQNFDWNRAGQNALVGATTGAVVGGLNKGINSALAKNGGNLLKGGNTLTRGINNFNQNNSLGRAISTIGTGAARGAVSGAVGGATGAGLSAALNNGDVLGSALQGAGQGLGQGAFAGGVMAGANMAINKTPGVNRFMQKVNQATTDWENSGDNFKERWANTRSEDTWGNRFIDKAKNLRPGLSIDDVGEAASLDNGLQRVFSAQGRDEQYTFASDDNTPQNIKQAAVDYSYETDGRVDPSELTDFYNKAKISDTDINALANQYARETDGRVDPNELVDFFLRTNTKGQTTGDTPSVGDSTTATELPQNVNTKAYWEQEMKALDAEGVPFTSPRYQAVWDEWKKAPEVSPETGVYRTLSGETETTNPDLMYGESALGNRTRRGMIADSLERFGNTLEGAQTNVTRAAAKDLGIESTGKVIENVRKKTGIVNLETQAELAKELTGGADSLMDAVQKRALSASENGQPYKVDTTEVSNNVESIVDKYADTNMFGSQKAKDRFISNLRRDISDYGSDVLTIANRMKSNAADLRGKGVASPTPADSAKAKIYTEIANQLDDLSYKAIPQANVDDMFETTIAEMRGRAQQSKNTGNNDIADAYTKLANALEAEPRTIKAFRSFKKDFVDASKIAELTARAENGAAVQMGRSFGGSLKRFGNTLLQRPINTGLAKAGGAINSLAEKVGNGGTPNTPTTTETPTTASYNPQKQVYNEIGRVEGEMANDRMRNASTLEDLVTPTENETSVYNSLYGNNGTNYQALELRDAMYRARAAGDNNAATELYNMYQSALGNGTTSTEQVKLTDKQRQANAAARALADFEGVDPNFAYDVSDIPIIGGIANLGGNEYASKAEALALQVGYMLSGATVNKEEAKNIGMAYVPQPRDNEAVRRSKLV